MKALSRRPLNALQGRAILDRGCSRRPFLDRAWRSSMGPWSGFTAITSVLGPVLGGLLVQYASWRWVFFINVPLAVIVLGLLFWRVPESRDEEDRASLDWWGALLATLGLGAIVYGLIE